jgi:hypothetical protein
MNWLCPRGHSAYGRLSESGGGHLALESLRVECCLSIVEWLALQPIHALSGHGRQILLPWPVSVFGKTELPGLWVCMERRFVRADEAAERL